MAVHDVASLQEPFSTDRLLQVRTGKIRPVFGLPVKSAIFKTPRRGPITVTKLGCEDDQHAFEFHGGPDKALLHYCSRHYDNWQAELPQSTHLFSVGGFGENLGSVHANEHNVCIGDIISIGDILVQVSLPRQPCYKLNHRFEVKDMSRRSQTQARTGWYYRILREGSVCEGDEIKLVKRVNPNWTVANVQRYLYIDMKNELAMRELVEIEGLGAEVRNIFQNRLNNQFEDQDQRLLGGDEMAMQSWTDYRIVEKKLQTPRITSFRFQAVQPIDQPKKVEPGSHVRIKLGGKLVRAYSVVTGDTNCLELGIALDQQSRGGSKFLHEKTKAGDTLQLGKINATFPLSTGTDHHIIIAGGIGITAFITALQYLQEKKQSYELHFAVRSAADIPFRAYLEPLGDNVTIYDKSTGQFLDILKIFARNNDNSHVYCCGPKRLMDGVAQAAEKCGIPRNHVHFEAFGVATSGDPFTVECAMSKKTLEVGESKSLLDILRDAGLEVDSSCEAGNCGSCRVGVRSGRIEHRGTALLESEKDTAMLSCVSRGIGHIVLDL